MDAAAAHPPGPTFRHRLARLIRIMFTTVAITLFVLCLAAYLFQGRLIYFPSRDYAETPREAKLDFEGLTLTTDDGQSIAAWYVPCAQAKGTILFCHANAGNMADRLPGVEWLHDLGYHVLIFDYRGYGRSSGRPSEQGTYRDAEAAWGWLMDAKGESPQRVVIFGESLGGAVAVELASRHTPAALVVESTFTNLVDIGRLHYPLLPVRLLCRYRYDSLSRIGGLGCPKLFIHARGDELVPFENGRLLFEAAAEPKRFLETPGGHNTGGFRCSWDYAKKMAAFIDEALAVASP